MFLKRKILRLKDYDYSEVGSYFVTICTKNRECVFGDVINGEMKLNDVGQMVQMIWNELPNRFQLIKLDEFIVMPNHVHGIVSIVGAPFMAPDGQYTIGQTGVINHAPTLGKIVRTFKAVSTHRIRLSEFTKFAWQRNYYERIIHNENELFETRKYVQENPLKWELDPENQGKTICL